MNTTVPESLFDHVFHDLVASVGEIIFRVDAAGRWTYLSDAWERLLARPGLARLGSAAVRDIHPADRGVALRHWAEVRAGKSELRRCQVRLRCASGAWLWMQASIRGKWYPDGRFRGAVGSLSDIASLKAAEGELQAARQAAESANKAKSEFLSTMSHELRTPLNAVIGLTESLLEMGPPFDPERTKRYVTIIHQSGRQLLAMINDILDLARIEAGRIQVNATDFDLGHLLAGVLDAAQHEIRGKALRADFPRPAGSLSVRADERLLRVVAQNLLSNAVKFTPKAGSVALRAAVTPAGVEFAVQDTGIGIAPEQQAKLFRPFEQLDASLDRTYGGTGLGLALVQRIVQLHGGEIAVESAPGTGSTFTVRLPAACVPPPPAPGRPPRERSVLIVDDDPRQQVLLGDFFRRRGFAVRQAERAQAALDALAAGVPGLLIADVNMPGMSGLALIARVRATPACAGLPILAVTALAEAEEGARCIAGGADAHLPKPVSLAALWQKTTALTGLSA
jgi:PAS domain S-box-containing protein